MGNRKEDTRTQFLMDKLQYEERISAKNLQKLTQQWRTVFRQARVQELRSDIAALSRTFESVLDRKDNVIKCLVGDLKEAEHQSSKAVQSHLQCLDQLLELQRGRLASLEQIWKTELEELNNEFNSERERIVSQHHQECAYLEDVTFTMEQRYREVDAEGSREFQSTLDEIKNKNIEEKHTLRLQLEGKAEELLRQFQQAQRSYKEATEHRQIAYESLRARDQSNAREIHIQRKKLQKIQDSIAALRAKLGSSQGATQGLQAARVKVTLHSQQLQAQINHARTVERSQLTNLTVHSNAAAKKLQGIVHKGEKLMRLAEMCRKLETEQEKVLPFYSSSLSAEEQSLERANAVEAPSEELAQAMQDYSVLDHFWQRCNKAQLERLCLERERSVLSQENRQLRVKVRQYLDGISVGSKILPGRNPPFRVSIPSLTVLPPIDAHKKRHTVVKQLTSRRAH